METAKITARTAGAPTRPEPAPDEPSADDVLADDAMADDALADDALTDHQGREDATQDDHADDEIAHHEHHPEEHAEEHGHRSLAATALFILVGVIFVGSLTLWASPKLAPYLPASMAQYLLPGQMDTQGRLADLEAALAAEAARADAAITGAKADIAALGARVDAAADSSRTDAAIANAQSAAEAAAADAASLATRLGGIETELTSLRDEFSAVSSALADAGNGEGAVSPEIAAAVAAFGARLEGLAASVEAGPAAEVLEAQIAALGARLEAVETSAADARDAQSETLGEVSTALRQARLQAAVEVLTSRMIGGLPYATKLAEVAGLTEAEPPVPLAAGADTGLATAAALKASFARYAQAAIAADVQNSAGEGTGLKALGWLRAQVAGRPTTEMAGDGVGAITSRIAARVGEGKLTEALAEADTLPEHSQAGLGPWLDQLRARVAAETALADWRAQIGAGG